MPAIWTTEVFDARCAGLRDATAARRIQARIDRVETGNFGDCAPVGEGASQMRIHIGPGYRVYFARPGEFQQYLRDRPVMPPSRCSSPRLFLASKDAAFVNGQAMVVDDGLTASAGL